MKAGEIAKKLNLTLAAGALGEEREISGGYIGDLLSLVMSKAKADDMWITIQTNINIIAVAVLTDVACIVIADGQTPDKNTLLRAESEGVALYTTPMSAYEVARGLCALI